MVESKWLFKSMARQLKSSVRRRRAQARSWKPTSQKNAREWSIRFPPPEKGSANSKPDRRASSGLCCINRTETEYGPLNTAFSLPDRNEDDRVPASDWATRRQEKLPAPGPHPASPAIDRRTSVGTEKKHSRSGSAHGSPTYVSIETDRRSRLPKYADLVGSVRLFPWSSTRHHFGEDRKYKKSTLAPASWVRNL